MHSRVQMRPKLISDSYLKGVTIGKLAGELREILDQMKRIDFKLVSVYDNAPAIIEIEVLLDCLTKIVLESLLNNHGESHHK